MFSLLLQNAGRGRGTGIFSYFRYLGAFGLFALAILDSCPVPTFGGPDVLLVILVSRNPAGWFGYAAVAVAGSLIGAYVTFRLARKAGEAYLTNKFGASKVSGFLEVFQQRGTGSLIASTAIPFPFPTSLVFAAAGASDYPAGKFLIVVFVCRCVRYFVLALIADQYGRRLIGILRHPTQYWGWLLLFAAVTAALIGGGVLFNRRLSGTPARV